MFYKCINNKGMSANNCESRKMFLIKPRASVLHKRGYSAAIKKDILS